MWTQRWKVLSTAIANLAESANPFFSAVGAHGTDHYGVANKLIIPEARELYDELRLFQQTYAAVMPPRADAALSAFLTKTAGIAGVSGIPGMGFAIASLVTVRAAMERHIADSEAVGRAAAVRAFSHLQRSIVADAEIAKKWRQAHQKGEVRCESLGAVHLLAHGIWAFKVNAAGERTDLVFNEPIDLRAVEQASPTALVLTEWKAGKAADAARLFAEARHQAKLYAAGSLASYELSATRYAVVVTDNRASHDDVEDGGVTYRYVNIAVIPKTPSKEARGAAQRV